MSHISPLSIAVGHTTKTTTSQFCPAEKTFYYTRQHQGGKPEKHAWIVTVKNPHDI